MVPACEPSAESRAVCPVCRSVMHQGGACMWAFSRRKDWSSWQSQNDPGVFVTYWQHHLRFIEQPIKNSNKWSPVVQLHNILFLIWISWRPAKACRVSLHFFCFHAIAIVCFLYYCQILLISFSFLSLHFPLFFNFFSFQANAIAISAIV